MLRIHWLQHVPFEGLGSIAGWIERCGHRLSGSRLWAGDSLPETADFDWLIVMGGPMGVYDEDRYAWLAQEKQFIAGALAAEKRILGICLGAQLMADALGARVAPNRVREIGWFPVQFDPEVAAFAGCAFLPETLEAFHWHGDRFEIPKGARLLARSEACDHQGFVWGGKALALQFHLETTAEGAAALIQNCANELTEGPYIQKPEKMLDSGDRFSAIHRVMEKVLDAMAGI